MRTGRWFSPLALLLCAGPVAQAQEPIQDDTAELLALLNTPVVSASKSAQSIRLAPAKIVAITAEEISRKGYQDLEEIFHDLAGMDFAMGRGVEWSTIFMRGMRTDNTDHFLMIWDGIIQNDIWKQGIWLSRQYPLSNIERIEIMYGPSSLLYGANAFGGIVNVILKKPKDVNGIQVQLGGGSFSTKWTEVNFGKEMGDWRFSANMRYFLSDEMDMNDKFWVDNAGRKRYHSLNLTRDFSPSFRADQMINGVPHWVKNGRLEPLPLNAYGDTKDWWVQGGIGYKGFELRAYLWYRHEMEDNWYVPLRRMHGPWTPQGSAIYFSHDHTFSDAFSLKSYIRTVTSGLDPEESYDGGFGRAINNPNSATDLQISNLFSLSGGVPTFAYYKLANREWRAGQQVNYTAANINSVFGWEYTSSKNYEDYNLRGTTTGVWEYQGIVPAAKWTSKEWVYTPRHDERNIAAFANIQTEASSKVSLAAGFRYDYNYVAGETGGFGHLYTGRMAAILTPSDKHRVKVIYGQAFQAPSAWQKFATVINDRVANPLLKPERMASTELIYEYTPVPRVLVTGSFYYNQITDQIQLVNITTPDGARTQNNNRGGLKVFGQEVEGKYFLDAKNSFYFNATFNNSKVPETGLKQAGLADFKANAGADLLFKNVWSLNVRAHYVASRDVPNSRIGTTQPSGNNWVKLGNEYHLASSAKEAGSYLTFDAVLVWTTPLKGLDARLAVYNLADKEYYDPGTRVPDGRGNNSLIIQQPRRLFVGFNYKF